MYIPPEFEITDPETIDRFLHENGFGSLTAQLPSGKLAASHVPFLMEKRGDVRHFYTHLANENELSQLADGTEVLLVFTGEHGYVSSSWYGHPNVPTWNYRAVHVTGTIHRLTPEELYTQLRKLTLKYEKTIDGPIDPETLPQRMIRGYLQHITGFRIEALKTEAAFKLSQNRNEKDFANIIEHLKDTEPALAKAMEETFRQLDC